MTIFNILNRFTGSVMFTAEIDCADDAHRGIRLGLAVQLAVKSGADLRGADLRGADLRGADLRGAYLRGANLRDANLLGADLRGVDLLGVDLLGVDMRGADLLGANLLGANLLGANLLGVDMRGVDMRGAPIIEDIHAKVYAAASQPGALDMGLWHCGTSHCRAGWVVTLSGQEGLDLEAKIGTHAAAMAIYMASDPERWKEERLPDFYCDNETALADMKRMAGAA